jgi:signal transduction histidine kinase
MRTTLTERKLAEAEREWLGRRLRQAETMEAVGRLAGGIAHDFNNVLTGILAYGEMLFDDAPADSSAKRYARNLLAAAARGRALVDQILAYGSSQRGKREPVDVSGEATQLHQVVMNLCSNAIQAMSGGGTLRRRARGHRLHGRTSVFARNARRGPLRPPERRGQRMRHG